MWLATVAEFVYGKLEDVSRRLKDAKAMCTSDGAVNEECRKLLDLAVRIPVSIVPKSERKKVYDTLSLIDRTVGSWKGQEVAEMVLRSRTLLLRHLKLGSYPSLVCNLSFVLLDNLD